jgi:peptide/nickel transport system substrate-binding protein
MTAFSCAALLVSLAAAAPRPLVVVNDVSDPVSLDPHREFDASSDNIINQIFDGLVRLTADGRIAPALAESWRRVDDLTLEFKLRRGVAFHDSEPFTARAVKFSLDRQLDPKRPAPNAGLLDTLAGAQVVDDYTVRLKTKKRDGVLLNKLPMFLKILPPDYLAAKGDAGFAAHPVGTGPFSFERWDKGREIELRANPSYWAGAPAVSPLVFKFLPMKAQARALRDGAADMVTDLSGLETERVAGDKRLRVVKGEDFYAVSLIPNSRRGPLADLRLRRAVTAAVDPHDLVRYAAKGNGRPMTGFTMPGEFGHAELDGPRFQPRLARALVAQASGGAKVPLKILVRAEIAQFGKVIAAQLRAAGFEPSLETASQEEVFQRIVRPNLDATLPPWDGDLLITHYVDPTAHAYFPYMIFVQSSGPYSLARDAEFDAAFAEMIGTLDPEKQKRQCARLERLVYDKRLAYSPVQVIRPYAMRRDLDYEPQVAGMLDFRAASWREKKDAD